MILARTPLRISLAGGGTDLPWYADKFGGRCITLAIDKYVHVSISRRYSGENLIHYRETESYAVKREPGDGEHARHPIIREVLSAWPIPEPFEIHTTADIDSNSGLGSSSAFTVCLLHAVWAARGEATGRDVLERLAEEAYRIEHDVLRSPIGRQDAYACALGGLLHLSLPKGGGKPDGTGQWGAHKGNKVQELVDSLLLFDTGLRRGANGVLSAQQARATENEEAGHATWRDAADMPHICGAEGPPISAYATILRSHWARKKTLAAGMTHPRIDTAIEACEGRHAGAKLVGAGGGGFILVSHSVAEVREQIGLDMCELGMREVPFKGEIEPARRHGSTILLNTENV